MTYKHFPVFASKGPGMININYAFDSSLALAFLDAGSSVKNVAACVPLLKLPLWAKYQQ